MSDRGTGREAAAAHAFSGAGEAGLGETETRENILGHLLKIEADAASLVDDAQAEADRRVAESEKRNRSRYDEEYAQKAAELDRAFEEEISRIRADYRNQLDDYRKSLDAIPVDQGCFSALMDELLAKGPRSARETSWGRLSSRGL
jgi:vacuolar-type H+-ATPase subunit H